MKAGGHENTIQKIHSLLSDFWKTGNLKRLDEIEKIIWEQKQKNEIIYNRNHNKKITSIFARVKNIQKLEKKVVSVRQYIEELYIDIHKNVDIIEDFELERLLKQIREYTIQKQIEYSNDFVIETKIVEKGVGKIQNISENEIFRLEEKQLKNIAIFGERGSGKSYFCSKIVNSYNEKAIIFDYSGILWENEYIGGLYVRIQSISEFEKFFEYLKEQFEKYDRIVIDTIEKKYLVEILDFLVRQKIVKIVYFEEIHTKITDTKQYWDRKLRNIIMEMRNWGVQMMISNTQKYQLFPKEILESGVFFVGKMTKYNVQYALENVYSKTKKEATEIWRILDGEKHLFFVQYEGKEYFTKIKDDTIQMKSAKNYIELFVLKKMRDVEYLHSTEILGILYFLENTEYLEDVWKEIWKEIRYILLQRKERIIEKIENNIKGEKYWEILEMFWKAGIEAIEWALEKEGIRADREQIENDLKKLLGPEYWVYFGKKK